MGGVLAAFFRVSLNEDVLGALRMFSALVGSSLAAYDTATRGDRISA
jgi:hypothetical protein